MCWSLWNKERAAILCDALQASTTYTTSRKTTGLESLLRGPRLTTLSSETDAHTMITAAYNSGAKPAAAAMRRRSLFGHAVSSDTAIHQGILSLADQAVASATNFLTGIIIGRAGSKEELGLYILGLSLILFMTDLQTSLITTPYMVYAPRLKGKAHALYTGSTLIHQLVFCLVVMLAVVCGVFAVTHGIGSKGSGSCLAGIGFCNRSDHASGTCSSRKFRPSEA